MNVITLKDLPATMRAGSVNAGSIPPAAMCVNIPITQGSGPSIIPVVRRDAPSSFADIDAAVAASFEAMERLMLARYESLILWPAMPDWQRAN